MPVNPSLVPSFRFPNNVPEDAAHPAVRKALDSHTKAITDLQSAIPVLKAQIDAKTTTVNSVASFAGPAPNTPTVIPGNMPAVLHMFFNSYDSSTGVFGDAQLAFTDVSGIATTAQIGTGTPAAGKYVDGAAGAWTALPVAAVTKTPVTGEYLTGYDSSTGAFSQSTPAGISITITTAALTGGGTQGSMTFVGGILTAQVQAT